MCVYLIDGRTIQFLFDSLFGFMDVILGMVVACVDCLCVEKYKIEILLYALPVTLFQGIFFEQVVTVQEVYKFTFDIFKPFVAGSRYALIRLGIDPDAGVGICQFTDDERTAVGRTVVDDNDFDVPEGLFSGAFNGFTDIGFGIVYRMTTLIFGIFIDRV